LSISQEEEWIDSVVRSDTLVHFIEEHHSDYDCLIFAPYLFGITYRGMKIAPKRSILVPCLHDEPYARLKIFRNVFNQATGIFFNSEAEQALADRIFAPGKATIRLVGMGIEPPDNLDPETFRKNSKKNLLSYYMPGGGKGEEHSAPNRILPYLQTPSSNRLKTPSDRVRGSGFKKRG